MAHILDQAVWSRVEALLTKPELVAAELDRLERDDSTTTDLSALEKSLAEVMRQQRNLVDQLAQVSGSVAALVHEKLAALDAQREQLITERERVLSRRNSWQQARDHVGAIQEWCQTVADNLATLTYEQKRLALDALGVQVTVWPTDHTPRWRIEARIPLTDEPRHLVVDTSRAQGR